MKLNIKAISEVLLAVKDYLFPYEKISKKFLKINSEGDLATFIKEKSAFVTQSTLYGYLKTRMGLKQNLMFTDDVFVDSVNKAKWNIFSEAVTDLTFFSISLFENNIIGSRESHRLVIEIAAESWKMGSVKKKKS